MYTLAIEHSACPLMGGKCGDYFEHERMSQVSVSCRYRHNVHHRMCCALDNYAEVIVISGMVI